MSVKVQIKSIIERLDKKIIFIQPIYEAIANSLEANATIIKVELFHDDTFEGIAPKITGFKITDNGEGFTKTNREAFSEFWTDNKAKLGCKGSGRFTWLSVFKEIKIVSEVSSENISVKIPFDRDFSEDKIITENKEVSENTTVLEFCDVTDKFYKYDIDPQKRVDLRFSADIKEVYESVKEYLLIKLFLLKNRNVDFNIEFKIDNETKTLSNADIPNLLHEDFSIYSEITKSQFEFRLYYYFFQDKLNSKKGYYCANDRATQKMSDYDLGFSGQLPNKDSFSMLLCSDYFNDKDDDSRNGLNELSDNKRQSFLVPLLFSDIRPQMQQTMKTIIKNNYPQIDELNKLATEDAINEVPYLASIIKKDNDIVKTKESLINKAKKEFSDNKSKAQNKFEKLLKDKSIDEQSFLDAVSEVSNIAAAELGEYILYRDNIIKALDSAINDDTKNEAYIHNIIMQKRTSSKTQDEDKYLLSNLWLLDDKFMTYSYAASDITIKRIQDEIESKNTDKYKTSNRPDLSIFFNRNSEISDLIMVELKGATADKNEKNKSITELVNDIEIVRKNITNISSVWSYIITTIDNDFCSTVMNQDFTPLFTNNEDSRSFYRYYKNVNTHVYIIDLKTIVSDSFARNKTFLDILKKQ